MEPSVPLYHYSNSPTRRKRRPRGGRDLCCQEFLIATCCFLLALGVFFYSLHTSGYLKPPETQSPPRGPLNQDTTPSALPDTILRSPCGTTPAAARAAGCIFDPNSFVWTHPRCYNAGLAAEFLEIRKWQWYADHTLTRELSLEEVLTSEHDNVAVSMEYHMQHCLFMWRLLHAQALGPWGKLGVDSYIGNVNHTNHCVHMVQNRDVPLDRVDTSIRIKFPDCGVE